MWTSRCTFFRSLIKHPVSKTMLRALWADTLSCLVPGSLLLILCLLLDVEVVPSGRNVIMTMQTASLAGKLGEPSRHLRFMVVRAEGLIVSKDENVTINSVPHSVVFTSDRCTSLLTWVRPPTDLMGNSVAGTASQKRTARWTLMSRWTTWPF